MEGRPPIRLPIGTIMRILLVLALGIAGLSLVAIAPQLLPQFQSYWAVTHYSLDATLRNLGHFDERISLSTWYISSMLLLAAMCSLSMAAFSTTRRLTGWVMMGLVLMFFSADKATGLHHALVHDFLYRLPFDLTIKKRLLIVVLTGLLGGLIALVYPLWGNLHTRSQRLWSVAALCFFCSDIGVDGLINSFFTPVGFFAHPILFSFLEQCIEQLGGLLLLLGLLLQLQKKLGDQDL